MNLNSIVKAHRDWLRGDPTKRFVLIKDLQGLEFRLFSDYCKDGNAYVAIEALVVKNVPFICDDFDGYEVLGQQTAP